MMGSDLSSIRHAQEREQLEAQLEAMQAEIERLRNNERRNCINWGPCGQHDLRMEPGPIPGDILEAIRNVDYWEGNGGDLVDWITDKLTRASLGGE